MATARAEGPRAANQVTNAIASVKSGSSVSSKPLVLKMSASPNATATATTEKA